MRIRLIERLPRAWALAVVTLVLVLLLAVAATLLAQGVVDASIDNRISIEAETFVASVEDAIADIEFRLRALTGLFAASEQVTAAEYREFAATIGLGPGMGGYAYLPIVAGDDLVEFGRAAAEEIPGFAVFEVDNAGRRVPVQPRPLHFPVKYFEPADSLRRPRGLDAGSPPGRLEHLMQAVESGQLTATPLVPLATTGEQGFLMYAPVITPSGHVEALVAGPVVLAPLVAEGVAASADAWSWTVEDVTGTNARSAAGDGFTHFASGQVADRTWQFELTPTADSPLLQNRFRSHWLLVFGLIFAPVAAAAVFLWVRGAEARRRVAALHEAMEVKDRFVATVSHELRTPMTAVLGIAEVLRDKTIELDPEERAEFMEVLAAEAADLADIVEDLLVTEQASAGTLDVDCQQVDLVGEVKRVAGLMSSREPVPIKATAAIARALADPSRVRQIVRNLLNNADAYGGSDIRVTIGSDDEIHYIEVVDNGDGVPQRQAAAIFEPYHSAHPDTGKPGSIGLGLSVARTLSRNMGGDLEYRRVGDETVFRLSLPAVPVPRQPDGSDAPSAAVAN